MGRDQEEKSRCPELTKEHVDFPWSTKKLWQHSCNGRQGSGMAEVTMMRVAATSITVMVNSYPLDARDVEVNTNECQVDTNK
jgi:hypothetical protein